MRVVCPFRRGYYVLFAHRIVASIVEKTEPAPKGRLDAPLESQPEQPQFDDDEGDSTWYLGKAKDEFHRRQQSIQDENEDPIQVRLSV